MGLLGKGVTLKWGTASGTYGTTVASIQNIEPAVPTCDDIDVTVHSSATDAKYYMAGLIDGGEVTYDALFAKAEVTTIYGIIALDRFFELALKDGSKWEYAGYVKSVGTPSPIGGDVRIAVTIKVSGKPTYTPAA